MPKDMLTDARVRTAKPKEKPYKLSDGGGLFLLVQPSGARLWRFKYRIEGKENLFAVGQYPDTTLATARESRDLARKLVESGIHPAQARKDEKLRNIEVGEARKRAYDSAFGKVATAWLEDGKQIWAPGTHRAKLARANRFLMPMLGTLPLSEVTVPKIRAVLEDAKAAGAWGGIHVKGDLTAIFDFALKRGLIDANPIPALRGLVRVPKSQSKAVLSFVQIREFYRGLRGYRGFPETPLCLKFIALTACRPGEAADAEWSEIDFEAKLWRRAGEKMKARRDHVSPLSESAIALLHEVQAITGSGRYLFPHRIRKTHAETARLSYAMRDLGLGEGTSPHCWRTTFSTWANENGFRPDAIERQLAHLESNRVRATYNKALLVDERRKMMEAWAEYLSRAEAENVVHIKFGAAS